MRLHREQAGSKGRILALVNGASERSHIRDAVHAHYDVSFATRGHELEQLLRSTGAEIAAVIVEEIDADDRPTFELIREIRHSSPGVPVVGYCRAGIQHSNDIRALVMAGAHELLFKGIDDDGVALRTVIASAQRANVGEIVAAALKEIVPQRLWPFVQRVAEYPAECQRVQQLAEDLGFNRKTLFNHCAQARFPRPQEMIAWCRLAVVGHLLDTTSQSVEAIAQRLDFPSDTALRNLVKRKVGIRATEIRQRGGMRCVLQAMEVALRRHRGESVRDVSSQ